MVAQASTLAIFPVKLTCLICRRYHMPPLSSDPRAFDSKTRSTAKRHESEPTCEFDLQERQSGTLNQRTASSLFGDSVMVAPRILVPLV